MRCPAAAAAPASSRGSDGPAVATRPSGVSIKPGATTFARTPWRAPSSATCRHKPASAAFVVSYAGMRVPPTNPATDEMNTIAPPSGATASAARHRRKCARTFTACTVSHSSADVPSSPRPRPMPTLHTRPSRPPSACARSSTMRAQSSSRVTSPMTTADGSALGLDERGRLLRGRHINIGARDGRTLRAPRAPRWHARCPSARRDRRKDEFPRRRRGHDGSARRRPTHGVYVRRHGRARGSRSRVHRDGTPNRVVFRRNRRPPASAADADPASALGVGRHQAHRLDRDRADADEAFASRAQPVRRVQLLDRQPRHLQRGVPRRMALRRRNTHRDLGPVQERARAGRLRPRNHSRVDESDRRHVRGAATRAVATARVPGTALLSRAEPSARCSSGTVRTRRARPRRSRRPASRAARGRARRASSAAGSRGSSRSRAT